MKTLLLLRHAKAARDGSWEFDVDRPLNDRGRSDAPVMGKVLKKYDLIPDVVLCSPAVRTQQTAELFLKTAGCKAKVHKDNRIYEASCNTLLQLIRGQQTGDVLLLIGHNPGMEELLSALVGGRVVFPTSGLACVDFEASSWADAVSIGGSLRWHLIPRLVQAIQ